MATDERNDFMGPNLVGSKIKLLLLFTAAAVSNIAAIFWSGHVVFFALSVLFTVWFVRDLRHCLQKKAFHPFKRIFGMAVALLGKIAKRLTVSLPQKQTKNRLSHYHDERSMLLFTKKNMRPAFKKMKWKLLTTNRERIRYIYIAYLTKKAKGGLTIAPADTPNELCQRLRERDEKTDERLFALYNLARYKDDETSVSRKDVESVLACASKRLSID